MRVHDPAVGAPAGRPGTASTRHDEPIDARDRRHVRWSSATDWPVYRERRRRAAGRAWRPACWCSTPTGSSARPSAAMPRFRLDRGRAAAAHEPAARRSHRGHHRRQPGPRPGDRRALTSRPGASVLICARDEALLEAAARDAGRSAPRRAGAWTPSPPMCRTRDDVDGSSARALAMLSAGARPGEQRRRLRPDGADRRRRLGRRGSRAIEINLLGSVLPCRALLPHFKAQRLRQDRPALRRRRDQPAAAPQRLRRVEGGRRALRRDAGARGARRIGIDVNAIAPGRAQHAHARRGARRRAGARRARSSTSAW